MTTTAKTLHQKIKDQKALLGVIGLGYVGLPLALAFSERGFTVLGFDTDQEKTDHLSRGESYIEHLDGKRVQKAVADGKLSATSDFGRLGEPDALLICVPTPLTMQRDPDLSYVVSTAEQIRNCLRSGQLVILESTTYPGTTEELLKEKLEESGLACGQDFFLAYSPEREDPANPNYGTTSIPKVVGGLDDNAADLATALYNAIEVETVRVSNARTAEAAKLTENIFRAVNIALVNELKMVYDRMGIDIWEVLDAAETKPFGFMRFNPGPGWGGHCIPIDPFYLSWKAREHGITPHFIELAGQVNVKMPRYVVGKLQTALNDLGKPLKGARVLLLGLAYKKDVADPRESPAFEILDLLLRQGAEVSYHDPHIPKAPAMRSWPDLPPLESVPLDPETLSRADAVVLLTDHSSLDYELVAQQASLIIDTRGAFRGSAGGIVQA